MCNKDKFIKFLSLAQAEEEDVDRSCIVDKDLPWDAENNYVDCKTDEQKKLGNTDCCKQDGKGAIGCCNKGDK